MSAFHPKATEQRTQFYVGFVPISDAYYSMTSSARASSEGGTSIPSAFAVLRLKTNSNFVGCNTGRSPGLSPLRIRLV
jgi:hypothetical protein